MDEAAIANLKWFWGPGTSAT